MKKLSVLLIIIAVLLSDWMCAVVAYNYRGIKTASEYGNSAPPSVAFVLAIPFLVGIVINMWRENPIRRSRSWDESHYGELP